jgi:hypothetical protein
MHFGGGFILDRPWGRSRTLLRAIPDSLGEKTLSVEYVRHIVSKVYVIFVDEIYERVLGYDCTIHPE